MLTKEQIKYMVDRFLMWRLPKPWHPDNGIGYTRPNYAHPPADHDWPVGTNLFDADQATAMVAHMIEGLPDAATPAARWRAQGMPDPTPQDYERAALPLGQYSDDELANAAYLCVGSIPEHLSNAAKQRMRWLSRRLCEAEAKLATLTPDNQ